MEKYADEPTNLAGTPRIGYFSASECFSNAWGLVQGKYWMLFLGSMIGILGLVVCQYAPYINFILYFFVLPALNAGICKFFINAADDEFLDIGDVFSGFQRYGSVLGASLLILLFYILFYLPLLVILIVSGNTGTASPGFQSFLIAYVILALIFYCVVGIATFFTNYLIMDKGLSAWQSIITSAKAARQNILQMFQMFILFAVINVIGVVLFCIGVFFVAPVAQLFAAYCYRSMFPKESNDLTMSTPPAPDQYGDAFGAI